MSVVHGLVTFVHNMSSWSPIDSPNADNAVEWTTTRIDGVTVVNVYKPPPTHLISTSLPVYSCPCVHAGDFNCYGTEWDYNNTNTDSEELKNWASSAGVTMLFDVKQPSTFQSARWGTTSNPDLAFSGLDAATIHR